MVQDLIDILNEVKERFTDNPDLFWTSYENAKEVRDELYACMEQLSKGNKSCLENLNIHFLPTSTFQEHSLQNGWTKEYIKLSEKFDSIYVKMKNNRSG